MGLTEIRTAATVDLKKAADQQEVLHVRQNPPICWTDDV